jgi:radical SAM superfamily enzyme YgiQ (UPF0313 family)
LLVQPRFSANSFWNYTVVCELTGAKYPAAPLGLITVAALLPANWDLRLVDENVRELTDADIAWADLVLTGGMLPQQAAILNVIDRAHKAGKPAVLGGPDPSEQPAMYSHADYLVLNEGELTVPLFLADLARGAKSGTYRSSERADMAKAVVPRFDLVRFRDYIQVGIQFSRGCPFNCEFCDIIELFGRQPRTKSPEQVLKELQTLHDLGYRGHVDFVDDNLIGHKGKARKALEAIADWSKRHKYPFYFTTEASINLAREPDLLRLMRECDFRYVFIGIESPDDRVLEQAQKTQNRDVSVAEAVRTFTAAGMIVNAGFILGFDGESPNTADSIIDLIEESGICLAMVGTLYALAQTQLSRRLQREGRLFDQGRRTIVAETDIDQTTSGLNFVTQRPRGQILADQARVIRHIYAPERYFAKVLVTALNVKSGHRHRVGFREGLRLLRGFARVCRKAGLNRRYGLLYWRTLFEVMLRNPRAFDVAVNLAAMYLHFSRQSRYVVDALDAAAERIRVLGEARYNELMVAGRDR